MEVDRLEVIIEAEAKKANAELDKLTAKLNQVSGAMSGIKGFGAKSSASTINSTTASLSKYTKSTATAISGTRSLTAQISRLAFAFYSIKRIVNGVGDSIKKSMDFGETINLFQTSFKKIGMETAADLGMEWGSESADAFAKGFIDEAQDFNTMLTNSLSLDPNIMMGYQALFAQMTNSMGLVADSSMAISESFTMLGTDIASLWNIDIKTAMSKLQSGLAGQIRPLRSLGIDISQTSLEMTALNYGIEDSVVKMSQAAKVQLRWLSIMDQAEVAFGDMAKTIESPANQLRILEQGWTNLSRSIGSVFMPIVTAVLPYINALVIALRRMVDTLASALGYELPDYSDSNIYTDVTGDIEGMEEVADSATAANEKLKKSLMGIDEINILSENKSTASGSIDSGSGYDVLDDAIGTKTESYMAKFNEEMAKMSNRAKEIADVIQPKLEAFVGFLDDISPILKGIAAAFVTYEVISWFGKLATAMAVFTTPLGIAALVVGALATVVFAIQEYNKKLIEEDLASRFGEIELSLKDIDEIAQEITDNKYSATLDVYITEKSKLDELEGNITEDVNALNKLDWKVSVGIELTPEEVATYGATVEKFITDSEAYIEQQQYVTKLAINAVINDDNFNTEISKLVDEYFNGSKGEMAQLGKDLRAEMDDALADGVIDSTEQKAINNLIKEIAEINEQVANSEFKARLQMITVDGDLTPDSFKELTTKIQEIITERIGKAEEASYTVLASVNAAYSMKMEDATTPGEKQAIQTEWDGAVKEITDNLSQTKAEISFEGTKFSTTELMKNYQTEISKASPIIQKSVKDAVTEGMYLGYQDIDQDSDGALRDAYALPLARLTSDMGNFWEGQIIDTLPDKTRSGAAEMFATLAPTKDEYNKIFEDALKAGTQVTDGVSAGLTDISQIGALAGNMESINFLLGQKLSTDQTFLDLLATSETAGADLDDSIIAGLKSKLPDLKIEGTRLVFTVGKAIKDKSEAYQKDNMPRYALKLISGYKSAFDSDGTAVLSVSGWLAKIDSEITNHKLPTVSLSTNLFLNLSGIDTADPLGILGNFPRMADGGVIKKFATGGVPNFGQMFIAREAGPELVGKIGNQSAVVNNDQIVQAVSQGVAGAVASVLGNGNGKQSIIENILMLDGDVVYRAYNNAKQSNNFRFNPVSQGG